LLKDPQKNYEMFEIKPMNTTYNGATTVGGFTLPDDAMFPGAFMPLYALYFKKVNKEAYREVYCYKDNKYILVGNDKTHISFDSEDEELRK
jgi:hypothetical protein